jgi:hypothetical protein
VTDAEMDEAEKMASDAMMEPSHDFMNRLGAYLEDALVEVRRLRAMVCDELTAEAQRLGMYDRPALTWSPEPPKEAGWYWWRRTAGDIPEPVRVIIDAEEPGGFYVADSYRPLDGSEWCLIPRPAEPEWLEYQEGKRG